MSMVQRPKRVRRCRHMLAVRAEHLVPELTYCRSRRVAVAARLQARPGAPVATTVRRPGINAAPDRAVGRWPRAWLPRRRVLLRGDPHLGGQAPAVRRRPGSDVSEVAAPGHAVHAAEYTPDSNFSNSAWPRGSVCTAAAARLPSGESVALLSWRTGSPRAHRRAPGRRQCRFARTVRCARRPCSRAVPANSKVFSQPAPSTARVHSRPAGPGREPAVRRERGYQTFSKVVGQPRR
jgi:hypothetical protein